MEFVDELLGGRLVEVEVDFGTSPYFALETPFIPIVLPEIIIKYYCLPKPLINPVVYAGGVGASRSAGAGEKPTRRWKSVLTHS